MQPGSTNKAWRVAVAVGALIAAAGCCGEAPASTSTGSGGEGGAGAGGSGAGGEGGSAPVACEDPISRALVRGLSSPVDLHPSKMMDADALAVSYDGAPVMPVAGAQRIFDLPLCAGHANVDVSHAASGELMGHVEWDVTPTTVSDAGSWGKDFLFHEKLVIVYGEAGAYKTDLVTPLYEAPPEGRWRIHVFNGLLDDSLTARLVPFDIETFTVIPPEQDPYEVPVVTGLPAKSSTVVEVDHPIWHDPADPQKLVVLEYWRSSAPGERVFNLMHVPTSGTPFETEIGFANWPDGTIAQLFVQPNFQGELGALYFLCRDPLWSTTDPACTD
jgi:hypothetical protein